MTFTKFVATSFFIGVLAIIAHSQWVPKPPLTAIPVIENCGMTGGDIAVARFPPFTPDRSIYYCQPIVNQLNSFYPGAGHFYFVHEFGHHFLNSADERAADCWAAQQIASAPNGQQILTVSIKHFYDRGYQYHPRYGTGFERAQRIYNCSQQTAGGGLGGGEALSPEEQAKKLKEEMSKVDTSLSQTAATVDITQGATLLIQAAQTNFVSLRGKPITISLSELQKEYNGLLVLQGFDNCRTYEKTFGNPSPTYGCKVTIANTDVETRFNQIVTQIKGLIPAGWIIQQVANELNFLAKEGDQKRTITVGVAKLSEEQTDITIWFSSPELKSTN